MTQDSEHSEGPEDPEAKADRLDKKAEAIRAKLTGLMTELDHRRNILSHRYVRPVGIGLGVVGLGALSVRAWRRRAAGPSRASRLASKMRGGQAARIVVVSKPTILKRVVGAALATAASVVIRRLVTQALARRSSTPTTQAN